jgi:hypothetical protein
MKTRVQNRLALLAGLTLLALLVIAPVAQAMRDVTGSRVASGNASSTALAATQGRGGIDLARVTAALRAQSAPNAQANPVAVRGRGGIILVQRTPANGVQSASSSSSARAAWIVAGSAAAVLLIGFVAWATVRRRQQSRQAPSASYCAQHPEDALCSAA